MTDRAKTDGPGSVAGHPAPQRGAARPLALWFGILAAPAAWSVQSLVNVGVASHACYPGLYPLDAPNVGGTWTAALVVSTLAVCVGAGAGWFSYDAWRNTRGEVDGDQRDGDQRDGELRGSATGSATRGGATSGPMSNVRSALEIGEGRTRFMAISGILTSVTFVIASLLHAVALFIVPACGL